MTYRWLVVAMGVSACGAPAPAVHAQNSPLPAVQRYVFHPFGDRAGPLGGVLLDSETGAMWSIAYDTANGHLGGMLLLPVRRTNGNAR
jgi:hypothetical protein